MIHDKVTNVAVGSPRSDAVREAPESLRKLRAVVLLSGLLRPTRLIEAFGASLLDLPIDGRRTLLDQWDEQVRELLASLNRRDFPVKVLIDQTSPMPTPPDDDEVVSFVVERDVQEWRGTGGVLHDISAEYHDDDYLLVASGVQVLTEPLHRLAWELADRRSDVCLVAHDDGVPSGLMLLRCGVLRGIAPRGFVDIKEQALPSIARSHDVTVVRREHATGLPIRSLSDYIDALVYRHAQSTSPAGAFNPAPFAERLTSTFSIIRDGASVDPSARIHDSVVLEGAAVHADAVVVRSVVCRDAVVPAGAQVVDHILTPRATGGR